MQAAQGLPLEMRLMEDLQCVGVRNAAGHPLEEIIVPDQWNWGSVRLITLLSAPMALGMAACTSEDSPTGPSAEASPARAAVKTYTAVDLGALAIQVESSALAINPAGQVVGKSMISAGDPDARTHAFVWTQGTMTDLGTLGTDEASGAMDINPAGQVVGWSADLAEQDNRNSRAVLWENGTITDLGTLGAIPAEAEAINSKGQVVGFSGTVLGNQSLVHAFLWESGVMSDLGTLGGNSSRARDISPSGQVVGSSETLAGEQHAFLWENGVMTDLGTLGGSFSFAMAINPKGQVVGYSETSAGEVHGFLWQNGVTTDLGVLAGHDSRAFSINARGQVVGQSSTSRVFENKAFLWQGGIMTVLPALGDPASGHDVAWDISPAGEVVGTSQTAIGSRHATLWTRK